VDDARRRALANPSTGRKDEIESYVHAVRRARANGLKV
jgi:hypothetical protein